MFDCWDEQPQKRPSFSILKEFFYHRMESSDRQHYAEQTKIFELKTEILKQKTSTDILDCMANPSHSTRIGMISNDSGMYIENSVWNFHLFLFNLIRLNFYRLSFRKRLP
jgi:hypothetical protein